MKFIVLSLSVFFSLSSFAGPSPVGKYTQKHDVMSIWANTAKKCKADKGRWDKKEKVCLISTSDDAVVTAGEAGFALHITTIGSNFHSCEFEGPADLVGNKLISEVPSEEYNMDTDTLETVTCVVTAELTGKNMSITTNGKCRSFCGANGWLEVDLVKVKK